MPGGHSTWRKAIIENHKIFTEEDHKYGTSVKFDSKNLISRTKFYHATKFLASDDAEIKVISADCCAVAKKLVDEGLNPVMLNMANNYKFAAGSLRGNTQEENLAGRSDLSFIIDNKNYPLKYGEGIYTDKVTFIRNFKGNILIKKDRFSCAVISMGFMNVAGRKINVSKWDEKAFNMIYNLLLCAVIENHDSIVLGAWGCGAFGNDSKMVAEVFKQIINKYFKKSFIKIHFAVIEDMHSSGKNYKTFCDVLT